MRAALVTDRAVFEPPPGSSVDESLVAFGTGRAKGSPSSEDQFADAASYLFNVLTV
jgi:hypothetical protein